MSRTVRVTLHPLLNDGTPDESVNLYPKTLIDGIVDRNGEEVEVQEKLVSGQNIKTLNGLSLLGSGNIKIEGTEYTLELTIDEEYNLTAKLLDSDDLPVSSSSVHLPLETMIVDAEYDDTLKEIKLILDNGEVIEVPIGDLVEGLVSSDDLETILMNYYTKAKINDLIGCGVYVPESHYNVGSYTLYDDKLYRCVATSDNEPFNSNKWQLVSVIDELNRKENISNKVTQLSNLSTDTQYPSAKTVYDNLVSVREIAEGKCKAFVTSYSLTAPTEQTFGNEDYYRMDDTKIETWADLLEYLDGSDIDNSILNSNYEIELAQDTIMLYRKEGGYYIVPAVDNGLKDGDIILILQTNVPDRWINSGLQSTYLEILETTKVDLTNYYTKTEADAKFVDFTTAQTITGVKTLSSGIITGTSWKLYQDGTDFKIYDIDNTTGLRFFRTNLSPLTSNYTSLGTSSNAWKNLYLTGNIDFENGAKISKDSSNRINILNNNNIKIKVGSNETYFANHVEPDVNNTYDLGKEEVKWKDLYLSGFIDLGNNNKIFNDSSQRIVFAINNNNRFRIADNEAVLYDHFYPAYNNSYSLGNDTYKWRDLYLAGICYTNKIQTSGSQFLISIGSYVDFAFEHFLFRPAEDNNTDLGRTTARWKDFYLSGKLTDGTNSVTVAHIAQNTPTQWYGTQAEYDALASYDSNTIYNILES